MERICEVKGCENVGEYHKKSANGKVYRRKHCSTHKRFFYGMRRQTGSKKAWKDKIKKFKESKGNKCELCGWKGPCDIHRKIPRHQGGGYTEGNIMCICPNCHRLEHRGLIKI